MEVKVDKWGWVYACVVGTGEMLFQVPMDVREDLLAGIFQRNFPFRYVTSVKVRAEASEETVARLKRNGSGPMTADLVIETFPWIMTKEGAVEATGRMSGMSVSWVIAPTEEIARAASVTWGESKVHVAKRSDLIALDGGKLGML